MLGSCEVYFVNRGATPAIEFEGVQNANYVARYIAEARAEGYVVELIDNEFVRVTFEEHVWVEFYPVKIEEPTVPGMTTGSIVDGSRPVRRRRGGQPGAGQR